MAITYCEKACWRHDGSVGACVGPGPNPVNQAGGRDTLVAALKERLYYSVISKAFVMLFDGAALGAAVDLAGAVDAGADDEAAYILGLFHWRRYLHLAGREDFLASAHFFSLVSRSVPEAVPAALRDLYGPGSFEPSGPEDPAVLIAQADAWDDRHQRTGDLLALHRAVENLRRAAAATPFGHSELPQITRRLGIWLIQLYAAVGEVELLAEAVEVGRAAVGAVSGTDSVRAAGLSNLGHTLLTYFSETGDADVLAEAVAAGRAAVDTAEADDPHRAAYLANLAAALLRLAESTRDADLALEAVGATRSAIDAVVPGLQDRLSFLSNLSAALGKAYEYSGDVSLIDEAVSAAREAAEGTPRGDRSWVGRQHNLAIAKGLRAEHARSPDATSG